MTAESAFRVALPQFLVIGAMKCGTTTLYEDLREHPKLRLLEKESAVLAGSVEGTAPPEHPAALYSDRIRQREPGVLVGEVATTYAMRPHFPGVAESAQRNLAPTTKIIYIVREPLARIISHHHHDVSSGRLTVGIDEAVRSDPRLLDYTRYAAQLRPWIDAFGRDQVLVLKFEDYVADRAAGMARSYRFLGVEAPDQLLRAHHRVHNLSAGKPVAVGGWRRLAHNSLYRRLLRPLLPERARHQLGASVLPKAPPRPDPPRPDTVAFIRGELADDQAAFASIVGAPWWTTDSTMNADAPPPRHGS